MGEGGRRWEKVREGSRHLDAPRGGGGARPRQRRRLVQGRQRRLARRQHVCGLRATEVASLAKFGDGSRELLPLGQPLDAAPAISNQQSAVSNQLTA